MAFIENRRIKRKAQGIALILGASLVLCGLIALTVWLLSRKPSEPSDALINSQPPVDETEYVDGTAFSLNPVSEQPVITPAASPVNTAGETVVTSVPNQVVEERSLILSKVNITGGDGAVRVNGSYAARFVNNTGGVMYGAYFNIGALSITSASVNGVAARYSILEGERILVIPFVRELMQYETAELYFEFSVNAVMEEMEGFTLPYPAYSSVFDIKAYVNSNIEIAFSEEVGEYTLLDGEFAYRPTLTGINRLEILFGKE